MISIEFCHYLLDMEDKSFLCVPSLHLCKVREGMSQQPCRDLKKENELRMMFFFNVMQKRDFISISLKMGYNSFKANKKTYLE